MGPWAVEVRRGCYHRLLHDIGLPHFRFLLVGSICGSLLAQEAGQLLLCFLRVPGELVLLYELADLLGDLTEGHVRAEFSD